MTPHENQHVYLNFILLEVNDEKDIFNRECLFLQILISSAIAMVTSISAKIGQILTQICSNLTLDF